MDEEATKFLAEISQKLDPLPFWMSETFWLAVVAALSGTGSAFFLAFFNHKFEIRKSRTERIRSAYDHLLNLLHEAQVIFVTNRVIDAVSGCDEHHGPFIIKSKFEEMSLKIMEAANKSKPFVHAEVTKRLDELGSLNYWGNLCILTRPDGLTTEVVAVKAEFNSMIKGVQEEIKRHFE